MVRCTVNGRHAPDLSYVALAVPTERLLEDIFLPNGTPVADVAPRVDAACRAELVEGRDAGEVARTLPIEVTVHVEGFEKLAFEWRADAGAVHRVLRPLH